MMQKLYLETRAAAQELLEKAQLRPGSILVVGCSTSEILGSKIGTASSPEAAQAVFAALRECTEEAGVFLAVQCCEHLNRAVITERSAAPGAEAVNVVPQPKAGGSLATRAWECFRDPVALEEIKADAGMDIGDTLIGMHLKRVAVPLRLEHNRIGEARVIAARTRAKFIGGARAVYDPALL